jgi:hypothetical protein
MKMNFVRKLSEGTFAFEYPTLLTLAGCGEPNREM